LLLSGVPYFIEIFVKYLTEKMPLFGTRQKSPQELVRLLKENLSYLAMRPDSRDDKRSQKVI